jgi:hypothetical protein
MDVKKIAMTSSNGCDIIDRKTLHSVRCDHALLSCMTAVGSSAVQLEYYDSEAN